MSDAVSTNIVNMQHRRINENMGFGGKHFEAMEPLSIEGLLPGLKSIIETGGLLNMAAALVGAKGFNNMFRDNLGNLGIINQPTPSMLFNLFQKPPNIISGR